MTIEEAKKILASEGFHMVLANKVINQTGAIREFEKPEVCEAIKVANANKWTVGLSPAEWDEREARLKKEREKHANASDKMGMTLEEAKDILKKEFAVIGLHKSTEPFEFDDSNWFGYEKPSVLEAFRVLAKEGYYVTISGHDYDMRKKRLEKEYEKNTKAPGSAENRIKEDSDINPALNAAASQFNDALLDEQAKKIAELTKENERLKDQVAALDACKKHNDKINRKQIKSLGKEIARLNKIIHKKNLKIEELRKESSRHLRGKIKMFGENFDLEQELKDKNAVLSDVAEELRLSKIREKNLTEVCQKYVKEVEDLREKLANNVVDKIDAQALKSAESALAWKEKLIYYKDMAIAYNKKEIADLGEKLAATKKELEGANNLVEIVRKGSKEYCEYGIAAEKMIQKMAKDIVDDRPVSSKDYKQYRLWAKGYRFNPQLPERTDEEEKKPNTSKSTLDDLKEKAYESFNAKAGNLGLVGSKDGNGIIDQMIGVDIAEEGGDHSAIIAQCCKNIAISKDEAEIIERCTKDGTELHYSEKDGFTYTNMFGDEMPIICLRGMCQVFTDEEIKNMKISYGSSK